MAVVQPERLHKKPRVRYACAPSENYTLSVCRMIAPDYTAGDACAAAPRRGATPESMIPGESSLRFSAPG